jgi:G3E family GTPase
MSARALKLPVHTTVITGSLNSGKTTFISRLIKIKPQNAVWAVLVNEFGAVGLDRIALESSAASQGLHVKQIAGGCMCCVTGGVLALSIAQLLRSVKPDRLLIEPSGLGHPAGLIDALQGEHLKTALQLNAVLCLVSIRWTYPSTSQPAMPTPYQPPAIITVQCRQLQCLGSHLAAEGTITPVPSIC